MPENQNQQTGGNTNKMNIKDGADQKGLQTAPKTDSKQPKMGDESGNSLEQLVTFIKANWKSVLTELVSTGVTAYLTHNAKDKAAKN